MKILLSFVISVGLVLLLFFLEALGTIVVSKFGEYGNHIMIGSLVSLLITPGIYYLLYDLRK